MNIYVHLIWAIVVVIVALSIIFTWFYFASIDELDTLIKNNPKRARLILENYESIQKKYSDDSDDKENTV